MFSHKHILLVALSVCICLSAALAEVQVIVQVDTSRDIYVGESFTYQIVIDGYNQPGDVDLSPLMPFNPQSAGNQDVSQTSISIINGRTTKQEIKRFVMNYSLRCDTEGLFIIPSVNVIVDGKTYKTNPVQVNILKPGETDQLYIELDLSETRCYVGQPVVLTVKFYRYAEVGEFNLRVPLFEGDDFVFEDTDSIDPRARLNQLGNGITVYVTEDRVTHRDREAILLKFSKVLIPKNSGEMTIEPAIISADVAVGIARSRDPFDDFFGRRSYTYKRFMVNSNPLKLNVLQLPDEGRPNEFYGLVGRYTISASAQPTEVGVGDPITLTIKVGSNQYLKSVRWPELEDVPALAANFKIPSERASPAIENGFKVFTQTIRANNDKIAEIPSIPLAYFDVEKGQYAVARSDPIKLDVSPTRILTASDLKGDFSRPVNSRVEAIKKGLSANYEGPDVLVNQRFSLIAAAFSPGYLALWAGPFMVLVMSVIVRIATYSSPESIAYRTKRKAASKALKELDKAKGLKPADRHDSAASAMKQYIADRFEKVAGSLTCDDCFEAVKNATDNQEKARSYRDIVAGLEAAKFSPAGTDVRDDRLNEIAKLIKDVNKLAEK